MLFLMAKTAFGQWQAVGTVKGRSVDKIFSCNNHLYFSSIEGNGVYKSTDNGETWQKKIFFEYFGENYEDVVNHFSFGDTLLFCTFNHVFRSFDDGETWSYYNSPGNSINYFYFGNRLYSSSFSVEKFYTENRGQTWIIDTSSIISDFQIHETFVYLDTTFIIAYNNSMKSLYKIINTNNIVHLTNVSNNFYNITTNPNQISIYQKDIISNSLATSSNAGVSWSNIPLFPESYKISQIFYVGNTLHAVVEDKIYYTSNNGQTWQNSDFPLKLERIGKYYAWNGYQFFPTETNSIFRSPLGNFANWTNFGPSYPTWQARLHRKMGRNIFYENPIMAKPVRSNLDEDNIQFINLPQYQYNYIWLTDAHINDFLIARIGQLSQPPYLFRSMDTAQTWIPINPPPFNSYTDAICYENDTLYLLTNSNGYYKIYSTPNFGDTWSEIYSTPNDNPIFNISSNRFYKKGNNLFLCSTDAPFSNSSSLRFKINNGIISEVVPTSPFNSCNLIIVGNTLLSVHKENQIQNKLYRSHDFGDSWIYCGINIPNISSDFNIFGDDSVYVFNEYSRLFVSVDKGHNWIDAAENLQNKQIISVMQSQDSIYVLACRDKLYSRHIHDFNPKYVSGFVYYDENNDGLFNNNDYKINGIRVAISPSGTNTYSDYSGFTIASLETIENDTLLVQFQPLYSTVTPPFRIVNQGDTGVHFAIYRTPGINDLRINISSSTPPRPGFEYNMFINISNDGSEIMDANIVLDYDDRFAYTNSTYTPSMATPNQLSWSIPNFFPLETRAMQVKFLIDQTTPLGEQVFVTATISPIIGDTTMENNTDSISDIVVGSFDPNDKLVNRPMYLSPMQVLNKTEMLYTVRFQNTGTWYAENVSILDTLHHHLDLSTFRVISASHDYNFDFTGNGIVRFNFPNINLPDSNMNEAASHGFIKYAIRLNNNIPLNDSITNTAHIYFDFNEAIVTNTTLNIVKVDASINEISEDFNVVVYPNPAKTQLNIRFEKAGFYQLAIYSIDGRLVYNENVVNAQHAINVASLNKGIYLLKISDENRSKIVKVVIQ